MALGGGFASGLAQGIQSGTGMLEQQKNRRLREQQMAEEKARYDAEVLRQAEATKYAQGRDVVADERYQTGLERQGRMDESALKTAGINQQIGQQNLKMGQMELDTKAQENQKTEEKLNRMKKGKEAFASAKGNPKKMAMIGMTIALGNFIANEPGSDDALRKSLALTSGIVGNTEEDLKVFGEWGPILHQMMGQDDGQSVGKEGTPSAAYADFKKLNPQLPEGSKEFREAYKLSQKKVEATDPIKKLRLKADILEKMDMAQNTPLYTTYENMLKELDAINQPTKQPQPTAPAPAQSLPQGLPQGSIALGKSADGSIVYQLPDGSKVKVK